MLVSVVVCTHSLNNYPNLLEAVDSLRAQTHRETEVVVVVDGNKELYQRLVADYGSSKSLVDSKSPKGRQDSSRSRRLVDSNPSNGRIVDREAIKIVLLEENKGVSAARNAGIRAAQGDILAFLDDDAVAERGWLESLVATYQEFDAAAVGGRVLPLWLGRRPDYLPEELYWLVGTTHEGFAKEKSTILPREGFEVVEVRNTFGPNMSFRREVFQKVGLFNENLGFARRGTSYTQAEEAEFALRMKQKLGQGAMYNPKALVYHKIPPSKVRVKALLKRAFYQGYSKALLRKLHPSADSIAVERSYLQTLLLKSIPKRSIRLFEIKRDYRLAELKELFLLVAAIISVGLGFVYGYVKA
jgi:glycosyltransferase involved in cell wall biosynthesis